MKTSHYYRIFCKHKNVWITVRDVVYENCLSLQGTGANNVDDWCVSYLNEQLGAYNPQKMVNTIRWIGVDGGNFKVHVQECQSLELHCNFLLNTFSKLPQNRYTYTYINTIRRLVSLFYFLWNDIIYYNKFKICGVSFFIPTNYTNLFRH